MLSLADQFASIVSYVGIQPIHDESQAFLSSFKCPICNKSEDIRPNIPRYYLIISL